jgi:hypothetical protein
VRGGSPSTRPTGYSARCGKAPLRDRHESMLTPTLQSRTPVARRVRRSAVQRRGGSADRRAAWSRPVIPSSRQPSRLLPPKGRRTRASIVIHCQ